MKEINISAHNIIAGGSVTVMLNILNELSQKYKINLLINNNFCVLDYVKKIPNVRIYRYPSLLNKIYLKLISNYLVLPFVWLFIGRNTILNLGNVAFPSFSNQYLLLHNAYPFYISNIIKIRGIKYHRKIFMLLMAIFIRLNLIFAKKIIVQTELIKKKLSHLGYSAIVIPNKINRNFEINKNKDLQIKKILFLSTYSDHKNFDLIIRVASYAKKIGDKTFSFLITLNHDHYLINYINSSGLDNIINLGFISYTDTHKIISDCDVVVNPSHIESFSTIYTEAFLYGLPILASDLDFSHEICGNSALYFNPYSEIDLYEKIKLLQNNKNLHNQLINNSLKRYDFYTTNNQTFLNIKF